MIYQKQPLSISGICAHLQGQGLVIEDEAEFRNFLENNSYYRLKGYFPPFKIGNAFRPGTTFGMIHSHYQFDVELRRIVLSFISTFEIALRARISETMAGSFGTHWYTNPQLFVNRHMHSMLIADIQERCANTSEVSVQYYQGKYNSPTLPPFWVVAELLTFGQLSNLFDNLVDNQEKKVVAASFAVVSPIFTSWLKSLNFIRNCCAHHARFWNRRLPLKPRIPTRKQNKILDLVDQDTDKRLFGIISCMAHLLMTMGIGNTFKHELKSLFGKYPGVAVRHMGFHSAWTSEKLWA